MKSRRSLAPKFSGKTYYDMKRYLLSMSLTRRLVNEYRFAIIPVYKLYIYSSNIRVTNMYMYVYLVRFIRSR